MFLLYIYTGRQFDERGNLENWWTDSTLTKFKDKTKCIVKQYGDYKQIGRAHV